MLHIQSSQTQFLALCHFVQHATSSDVLGKRMYRCHFQATLYFLVVFLYYVKCACCHKLSTNKCTIVIMYMVCIKNPKKPIFGVLSACHKCIHYCAFVGANKFLMVVTAV
jgi:hypothetical protein